VAVSDLPRHEAVGARRRQGLPAHLAYLLPTFLFIAALNLLPVLYTVYLSFTNASLLYPTSRFVGLDNYGRLIGGEVGRVVLNTFVFVAGSVVLQVGLGLGLALLLNLPVRGRVLMRTIVLATWIMPEVVAGFAWQLVLTGGDYGLANGVLSRFGLDPVMWLGNPSLAMACLIFVNVWRGTAFSMVLQLAALQTVPRELLEAATVDGAGPLNRFRHVTLPIIAPVLLVNLVNNTLGTFNVTALVFSLTNGGPARATEVLALTMYNAAFGAYDLGFASAIAMLLFAINVALVVVYLRLFRPAHGEPAA
jgi:multiple sugar transport system permease protein